MAAARATPDGIAQLNTPRTPKRTPPNIAHLALRLRIAIQAVALLQAQQVLHAAGVREARPQLLGAVAQQALAHGRSVRCSQGLSMEPAEATLLRRCPKIQPPD